MAELCVPQQFGAYARLLAARPDHSGLAGLVVGGTAIDRDGPRDLAAEAPAGVGTLDVLAEPPVGARTRSLVLVLRSGPDPVDLHGWSITAESVGRDGATRGVPPSEIRPGIDTVVLLLGDQDVSSIRAEISRPGGSPPIVLHGAWRYGPS